MQTIYTKMIPFIRVRAAADSGGFVLPLPRRLP
jgi:hypothetical protein